MKHFKSIIIVLLIANLFVLGYKFKKSKPEIITKTKTEKVYDFTQNPEMIKVYANTFGYVLIKKEEYEKYKTEQAAFTNGFKQGFKKGLQENLR